MTDSEKNDLPPGGEAYLMIPEDERKKLEQKTGIEIDSDKALLKALDIAGGRTDADMAQWVTEIEQKALKKLQQQRQQS